MITTDRQQSITKNEIQRFETALSDLLDREVKGDVSNELFRQVQIEAVTSQLEELRSELAEYEAIKSGRTAVLELDSLIQLPEALIAARIASHLTQVDLAKRIGVHEQQIQRYEATRYESASMRRLLEVAEALDVGIREDVLLPTPAASKSVFFSRLGEAGLGKELILQRIVPSHIRAELESYEDISEGQTSLTLQAASAVGRVYSISPSEIFSNQPLRVSGETIGTARFNARANANQRRLVTYSVYAHYLARLVLNATPELESNAVPTDPIEFRSRVIQTYRAFGFEQVVRFAWDQGIPVIPLNDPGAFHAALWRIGGRNVVVLNRRGVFASRSLIDLLHEIRHAGEEPSLPELSVIEEEHPIRQRKTTTAEKRAVHFSVASALNGREEELAAICYQAARNRVELLTSVVPKIARQEAFDLGVLADYLAYRLQFEQPPVDWWAAATNLQPRDGDAWRIARSVLHERIDLSQVDRFDRDLLTRALAETEG